MHIFNCSSERLCRGGWGVGGLAEIVFCREIHSADSMCLLVIETDIITSLRGDPELLFQLMKEQSLALIMVWKQTEKYIKFM